MARSQDIQLPICSVDMGTGVGVLQSRPVQQRGQLLQRANLKVWLRVAFLPRNRVSIEPNGSDARRLRPGDVCSEAVTDMPDALRFNA